MDIQVEHETFITLKMSEAEAVWLRNRMQNYIEPMRPATQPPVLEPPEDEIMRGRFFNALRGI